MLSPSRVVLDGGVLLEGERFAAAGPWVEIRGKLGSQGEIEDLGESLLFPGLINAHCHLDYTGFAGRLTRTKSFSEWIQSIVSLKKTCLPEDYRRGWTSGAEMLLRRGTTTVLDIEAVPERALDWLGTTPLRVVSCLEVLGFPDESDVEVRVGEVMRVLEELASKLACGGGTRLGVSPHALYSTTRSLISGIARAAFDRSLPLTFHLAESREEEEMFLHGRGPLFEWLGNKRGGVLEQGMSPVRLAAEYGLLDGHGLAVHVNYLGEGDAALLAKKRTPVVHCPRSHQYFGHDRFDYTLLRRSGVPISVGTDSLASVECHQGDAPCLDLLEELRVMRRSLPLLPPSDMLLMVMAEPASALGWDGVEGEIRPGALADCALIPFNGRPEEAAETLVNHRGDVSATMIGGAWHWRKEGAI